MRPLYLFGAILAVGCAAVASAPRSASLLNATPHGTTIGGPKAPLITHGDWQQTPTGLHVNVCVAKVVVAHPCVPCDVKTWGEVPTKCEAEWKRANGQ
jgi:hypothetical protein